MLAALQAIRSQSILSMTLLFRAALGSRGALARTQAGAGAHRISDSGRNVDDLYMPLQIR